MTLAEALEKSSDLPICWQCAKAEGASEAALAAILAAPTPPRAVLSPTALETPTKARTPTTIPAPPGEDVPLATKAPSVTVKLPRRQLKLKI